MPAISITPDMVSSYRLLFPNRYSVGKVVAKTLDKQTGGVLPYEIENKNRAKASSGAVHTERHLYPDEETAKSAAQAKMDELNRQTVTGSLEMRGRADIVAELEIKLNGFKVEANGQYLVESVTHNFSNKSWITSVEVSAGKETKATVGEVPQSGSLPYVIGSPSSYTK